jgi:hypothetical protein
VTGVCRAAVHWRKRLEPKWQGKGRTLEKWGGIMATGKRKGGAMFPPHCGIAGGKHGVACKGRGKGVETRTAVGWGGVGGQKASVALRYGATDE